MFFLEECTELGWRKITGKQNTSTNAAKRELRVLYDSGAIPLPSAGLVRISGGGTVHFIYDGRRKFTFSWKMV